MSEDGYSKNSVAAHLVDSLASPGGARAGDFKFVMRTGVSPDGLHYELVGGMNYVCPGCRTVGYLPFRKPSLWPKQPNDWHWNGVRSRPTLKPSIHHVGCWHGHLTNGVFESC